MSYTTNIKRFDTLGALASGLCLIHCIATPFIFIAHAGVSTHDHGHGSPTWWGLIDIFFLLVSLAAVWWSARNTASSWMPYLLGLSWLGLAAVILNEKLSIVHIPEATIYIPALSLVALHLYNRRYCLCSDEASCDATHLNSDTQ